MQQKTIVWESQHYEFNSDIGRLDKSNDDPNFEFDPEDSYNIPTAISDGDESISIQKIMHTPFGLWSVDDSMNPFRQFKFWMGHTNFSLGRNAQSILKRVPGVEVLRIITRYRFIIGIGQQFKIRDVRTTINRVLCGTENVIIEED